jgi:hypothetical protein
LKCQNQWLHVITGNLNKAVSRNLKRFIDNFMFQVNAPALRMLQKGLKQGTMYRAKPDHSFIPMAIGMKLWICPKHFYLN